MLFISVFYPSSHFNCTKSPPKGTLSFLLGLSLPPHPKFFIRAFSRRASLYFAYWLLKSHDSYPNTPLLGFAFQRLYHSPPFPNSPEGTLTEDEANFDEGPREATHVPQVQQGRRSPLLLRQGPQPYCLVCRQRRTPRHLSRPQRRRLVLRRLKQVPY